MRGIAFLIAILFALPAQAYVGPGLGAGMIAAVAGFLIALALALYAVIWFPLKRLVRKKQKDTRSPE